MFVEVVNMTNNTQFKTLVNTWLNQKKPMITPSTHASFTLIAENHLIPYFGKRKIGSITETDIQSYISYLYNAGRLDNSGGLTVKTIRDVILVLRLAMEFAYKERAIPLLNWDLVEYPKELGIKKVVSLSKDQELALIQCIYMDLNRRTAGILVALFTGLRIGELCGIQMKDAGAALVDAFKDVKGLDPVQIGTYRGFTMSLTLEDFGRDYVLTLKGQMTHRVTLGKDPRGNLTRIDNALNGMAERLTTVQGKLDSLYSQMETAKQELDKPFPQEAELKAKSAMFLSMPTAEAG